MSTTPAPARRVPDPEDDDGADGAGRGAKPAPSSPVFVDGSGQRRKNWRRLTIAVIAALCGYACLLGIGFAGGPIPPAALLPVPGVPGRAPATSAPSPTGSGNHVTVSDTKGTTHSGQAIPSHADRSATGTARSTHSTAVSTGASQPSATPTASVSTTPSGTTAVTTKKTASTTHGPPATPPGHSRSKTP